MIYFETSRQRQRREAEAEARDAEAEALEIRQCQAALSTAETLRQLRDEVLEALDRRTAAGGHR
jgi:hypothetical protein